MPLADTEYSVFHTAGKAPRQERVRRPAFAKLYGLACGITGGGRTKNL